SGSSRAANYKHPFKDLITRDLRPCAAPRAPSCVLSHLLRHLGNTQSHPDVPEGSRPVVSLPPAPLRWTQLGHLISATLTPRRPHLCNEPAAVTHNKEPGEPV